ncbi:hypothetical protein HGA91_01770 [candidate division WWE3 bacterium]|nr:hypothetical protein [candidate division WWE3 bacterium]
MAAHLVNGFEHTSIFCPVIRRRVDSQNPASDWTWFVDNCKLSQPGGVNDLLSQGWTIVATTPVMVEERTQGIFYHLQRAKVFHASEVAQQ